MSENLDLVRSIYAKWERGDFGSVEWAGPRIEYVRADGPEPDVWTELAGLAEGFSDWLKAWEGFRFGPDEYRELDNERVIVLSHAGGRGKTSGVELTEITTKAAALFHIHGGMVTRLVIYIDRERALADLGLEA